MKNFFVILVLASVISCNGTKNTTAAKDASRGQQLLEENMQQKQAEGIDLFAKGAIPASWTLEIDFDKIIRFRSLDGTDYKSTPVGPVNNAGDNSSSFTTRAGKGNMVIKLYEEACTDAMSGEKFNKKITVSVDGKLYEGCGQYLSDVNLNGKWILDKIGIETMNASHFAKGLPELAFDLSGGSLTGHDGCNRVSGSITVMGNRILFSPLASTKMACPGNTPGNEFVSKISDKFATYYFKDGQLVLYLIDDSTISFKKG